MCLKTLERFLLTEYRVFRNQLFSGRFFCMEKIGTTFQVKIPVINFREIVLGVRNLKVFDPFLIPHFIALLVAQLIKSESYSLSRTTEYTL